MSKERSYQVGGSGVALISASFLLCLTLHIIQLPEVTAYKALLPANPENPGKCIYRGDVLQLGVNNGIPPCQRLTCNEDGTIFIEGCGKSLIEKCNRGERIYPSKPYPECCMFRYKCKKDNGVPFYIERNGAEGA